QIRKRGITDSFEILCEKLKQAERSQAILKLTNVASSSTVTNIPETNNSWNVLNNKIEKLSLMVQNQNNHSNNFQRRQINQIGYNTNYQPKNYNQNQSQNYQYRYPISQPVAQKYREPQYRNYQN